MDIKRNFSLYSTSMRRSALPYLLVTLVTYTSFAEEIDSSLELTPLYLAECARKDNPALRLAHAQLEQAKSQLTLANRSIFPTLNVDGLLAPLPARRLLKYCVDRNDTIDGLERVIVCPNQGIQDDARLSDIDGMGIFVRTSATLTQPLYTFGKISHGREAAQAGYSAVQELTKVATVHFDHLAFQTYYGLALAKQAKKVFRKGKRHLRKVRKSIEKGIEKGQYTSNDLRKLKIKESQFDLSSSEVESHYALALRNIKLSCKLDKVDKVTLQSRKLKPISYVLEKEERYLKRALENRPEIKAAKQQIFAREALRAQALANFFPNLALIATFGFARGTSAEDNPDPFANDPFNVLGYGAYLGLSWRLNFAQLTSKLQASEAAILKAKAELHGLTQRLNLEMSQYYLEVQRRQMNLKIREDARLQAKQLVSSTMMNYNTGLIKTKAVLDAIQTSFTQSLEYDREVYDFNLAVLRLTQASGVDPFELFKQKNKE